MESVRFQGGIYENEGVELADLAASVRDFCGLPPDRFYHAGRMAPGSLGLGAVGDLGWYSLWDHHRRHRRSGYHKGHGPHR